MSILLGIVDSHFWVFYNIPELGIAFKNGIFMGNKKGIYSNFHFPNWEFKLFYVGLFENYQLKPKHNLKWEFKNILVPISTIVWNY